MLCIESERAARMLLGDAVNSWLNLAVKCYAPTTYVNYRRYLYRFVDFLPSETRLKDVTIEHLERFLMSLNVRKSSANTAIIVLKSFFRTMNDWTGLPNPTLKLKKYKCIYHQRFLSESEYAELITQATPKEHALLQLLSNTGIRIGEAISIGKGDVHDNMLTIASKGRQRTIPLNSNASNALRYLFGDSVNLLKSLKSRCACCNVCYRLARRANIRQFSPHSLRRLFANRLRRHGIDVYKISKALGHNSINTTMIYFGLDGSELIGLTDFMVKDSPDKMVD